MMLVSKRCSCRSCSNPTVCLAGLRLRFGFNCLTFRGWLLAPVSTPKLAQAATLIFRPNSSKVPLQQQLENYTTVRFIFPWFPMISTLLHPRRNVALSTLCTVRIVRVGSGASTGKGRGRQVIVTWIRSWWSWNCGWSHKCIPTFWKSFYTASSNFTSKSQGDRKVLRHYLDGRWLCDIILYSFVSALSEDSATVQLQLRS